MGSEIRIKRSNFEAVGFVDGKGWLLMKVLSLLARRVRVRNIHYTHSVEKPIPPFLQYLRAVVFIPRWILQIILGSGDQISPGVLRHIQNDRPSAKIHF